MNHFFGALLEPLNIGAMPLLFGRKSVSGPPVGSPATIGTCSTLRHITVLNRSPYTFPWIGLTTPWRTFVQEKPAIAWSSTDHFTEVAANQAATVSQEQIAAIDPQPWQ